jgi:predicted DCC family thiol-disulfide oxidoreductase YuxK
MEINRPEKPTLLWDGECGFCAHWIRRWEKWVGESIDYRTYQDALSDFPQVDAVACAKAVQLVLLDGHVVSAAHAVLQSLALGGRAKGLLARYERSPAFRRFTESTYRFVAANRNWLPRL